MAEQPPQEAVDLLEQAVRRSKRKTSVRLPQGFARDPASANPTPPLARILHGGGEVRLKVFLTTLMMATKAPHMTKVSSSDLAASLGLRKPETAGSRRVNKAFADLVDWDLVSRDRKPGYVPETTILDPAGSGEPWDSDKLLKPYITLPIGLWQRGWLLALSGRSLALLVILRELTGGRASNKAWVPGIRKRQYGLSDDTWTAGTQELVDFGLLTIRSSVFSSRGEPRRRNEYTLFLERLTSFGPGGSDDVLTDFDL